MLTRVVARSLEEATKQPQVTTNHEIASSAYGLLAMTSNLFLFFEDYNWLRGPAFDLGF